MFKTNYKATLKTLFRSPITLIALGVTVILAISTLRGEDYRLYDISTLRNDIFNHPLTTCVRFFPSFIGILISANILLEKNYEFSDLIVCARKSPLSIYLSKLCAIWTVTLLARLIYYGAMLIYYWTVHYPANYVSIGITLPLKDILGWYAIHEAIWMPFSLLGWTAIAVFAAVATNLPIAGAVTNVGYYLLGNIIGPLGLSNFYFLPVPVFRYVATWNYIDDPEKMAWIQSGLANPADPPPLFPEALITYIGWIVFSLALLTASYFILKRRYRT